MRDFSNRYLQENKGSDRPSKIIVLDTETKHVDDERYEHHYMDFGWCNYFERNKNNEITREQWKLFETSRSLWDFVFSKCYDKSTLYVFGHNIYFDLQCSSFFDLATEYGWKLKFIYDKGLTFILSIFRDKRKIKIISTTNYYDFSLKKIGEMIGLPKMEVDFETDSREYKIEYCKRDVAITRLALLKYIDFITVHDMGNFGMTKASQAFNAYRHRFMQTKICNHKEEDIIELERESYLGGRNEAFEIGELNDGPFYHYDINSMYPFVMRQEQYPTRLIDVQENMSTTELSKYLDEYCAIAEVSLYTEKPIYGKRYNGKVIFPVGKLNCTLPTGSLKYALERNQVKNVRRVAFYECNYIFREYVDYFYNLKQLYKQENNEVYTRIVKIFLNSLYGKFGQKNSIEEHTYDESSNEYYRIDNYDETTNERWTETMLLHTNIAEKGEEEAKTSMVAIPSHVTDYARLILWELIDSVGYQNALYCDTDSIKIREKDKCKITREINPYKLGALSLEDITNSFTIHGCKDYSTEKSEKIKGVPKNYTRIDANTFKYKSFLRLNSHLRKQISDHYLISEVIKTNRRVYDKGIVTLDGRVHPLRFKEW